MTKKHVGSYTVCEDQPMRDKYDVPVRTFCTLDDAISWLSRTYDLDDLQRLSPHIRRDSDDEVVYYGCGLIG